MARLKALDEVLLVTGVSAGANTGLDEVVERDDNLNCGNVGDTGRGVAAEELEGDIDDVIPVVRWVVPGFSSWVRGDKERAATDDSVDVGVTSALMIGMSLIFGDVGDAREIELEVTWPNPLFT